MFPIKKISATISSVVDLSQTAREITLTLSEPLPFVAGSFVNLFLNHEGKIYRRAFSISSSDTIVDTISISVRLNPKGALTPLLWRDDIVGTKVEVMGPLGLNTANKMTSDKIFLFGFGVGAGVVKSLASHFINKKDIPSLTIMTGNRSEKEILHKDYFDQLTTEHPQVNVQYVVSENELNSPFKKGYIQEHVGDINFDNSNVYICGQEIACNELISTINKSNPINCSFFIEGFH